MVLVVPGVLGVPGVLRVPVVLGVPGVPVVLVVLVVPEVLVVLGFLGVLVLPVQISHLMDEIVFNVELESINSVLSKLLLHSFNICWIHINGCNSPLRKPLNTDLR